MPQFSFKPKTDPLSACVLLTIACKEEGQYGALHVIGQAVLGTEVFFHCFLDFFLDFFFGFFFWIFFFGFFGFFGFFVFFCIFFCLFFKFIFLLKLTIPLLFKNNNYSS